LHVGNILQNARLHPELQEIPNTGMVVGSQHQRHPRAHDEHGTVVLTNQVGVMVDRYNRFCERYRVSVENDVCVNNGYEDKFLNLCEKYCFSETISRVGHQNFEFNTPYIVPGCSPGGRPHVQGNMRCPVGLHVVVFAVSWLLPVTDGQWRPPTHLHQCYCSRPKCTQVCLSFPSTPTNAEKASTQHMPTDMGLTM
jgi:hypothetical protein